jgi:hypothetical protein
MPLACKCSHWSRAAVLLVAMALTLRVAQADGLPWKTGDSAPSVAGVSIGDARERVEMILGKAPEVNKGGGALVLLYPERGLAIVLDQDREAAVLMLKSRAAGELGGIRVGDARDVVLEHWGAPSVVQGAAAMYIVGGWAVTLELGAEQQVTEISVARVFGNTDLG